MKHILIGITLCLLLSPVLSSTLEQSKKNANELEIIINKSKHGDSGAQLLYGLALMEGRYGLNPDPKSAVIWFKNSANDNNHYAQLMLANCYSQGKGVEKSIKKAVKWWSKSAHGGNALAQYNLGNAYLQGTGIQHDDVKAIKWLTSSAKSGNSQAQFAIGKMYHDGYVVAQNHEIAKDWLTRAASNGHIDAINLLGAIHSIYKDMTLVSQHSLDTILKKATQGDPESQYELAMHYKQGAYDDKQSANPDKALFWLEKSAKNGHLMAMKSLATIYSQGWLSIKKDKQKALYWQQHSLGQH
ncbi:MAG: tetratricopeptide repeat protein [bacterium]